MSNRKRSLQPLKAIYKLTLNLLYLVAVCAVMRDVCGSPIAGVATIANHSNRLGLASKGNIQVHVGLD